MEICDKCGKSLKTGWKKEFTILDGKRFEGIYCSRCADKILGMKTIHKTKTKK